MTDETATGGVTTDVEHAADGAIEGAAGAIEGAVPGADGVVADAEHVAETAVADEAPRFIDGVTHVSMETLKHFAAKVEELLTELKSHIPGAL